MSVRLYRLVSQLPNTFGGASGTISPIVFNLLGAGLCDQETHKTRIAKPVKICLMLVAGERP